MAAPIVPIHIVDFLRQTVRSNWGLEVLLLLRSTHTRTWSASELCNEIRGSIPLVQDILDTYVRAQLVRHETPGKYRYAPIDAHADSIVTELTQLHAEYPLALIKEIIRTPNEKIKMFVDAFRLKKD